MKLQISAFFTFAFCLYPFSFDLSSKGKKKNALPGRKERLKIVFSSRITLQSE
jgi:hypothetical protein